MVFVNTLFNSVIQYVLSAVVAVGCILLGVCLAKSKARKKNANEEKQFGGKGYKMENVNIHDNDGLSSDVRI